MARLPRIDLPGIPQHVVQRGNNRLPCFLDDQDRLHYVSLLREGLAATECRLHAYVLMDNHVHLLLTPPGCGAIGKLMQKIGRRYVGLFNARHGRTGTLWEDPAEIVRAPAQPDADAAPREEDASRRTC